MALAGAACISPTDQGKISVNLKGIERTFDIAISTHPILPLTCSTVDSGAYVDPDFARLSGARITDIELRTIGSFGGAIGSASLTLNGTPVLSFFGNWSSFHTPRSLLYSDALHLNPAGLQAFSAPASRAGRTSSSASRPASASPWFSPGSRSAAPSGARWMPASIDRLPWPWRPQGCMLYPAAGRSRTGRRRPSLETTPEEP